MVETSRQPIRWPRGLALWEQIDAVIAWMEGVLLVSCLAVMILMTFSQVLLRNFFQVGIFWFGPVVRHLVLWIGFIGASLATHRHHHVNIDALGPFLKGPKRHAVKMISDGFASFICFVLLWASYGFVKDSFASGEKIYQVFPAWVAQGVLPYSFLMMSLRFGFDAIRQIWRFSRGLGPENVSDERVSSGETP